MTEEEEVGRRWAASRSFSFKRPDPARFGLKNKMVKGIMLDPEDHYIDWTIKTICPKCGEYQKIRTPEDPPGLLYLAEFVAKLTCQCGKKFSG